MVSTLSLWERAGVRASTLSDHTISRFFSPPSPTLRTLMHKWRVLGQRRARIAVLAARIPALFQPWLSLININPTPR
ncbi:hypothetical protein, partial [Enterobacter intestinihominis]